MVPDLENVATRANGGLGNFWTLEKFVSLKLNPRVISYTLTGKIQQELDIPTMSYDFWVLFCSIKTPYSEFC